MTPEEILKAKQIKFQYSGNDLLVHCLNPEHEDNNPSMRIDKITGKFGCFSCKYSGNIYSLFGIYRNLLDVRVKGLKEKIAKMTRSSVHMPLAAQMFHHDFRGIRASTLEHFKAFTLPGDKDFDGRLVFPIIDINDDIIGFCGRYMYSKVDPKYLNKPDGVNLPLFPASPNIINGSIVLVEGLIDMLKLYDKGITNAVCAFGAGIVSKSDRNNHKLKNRFASFKLQGVTKLYIMFDGDKAGRDGAKAIYEALKDNYIIELIELEDGTDPGELSDSDLSSLKDYIEGDACLQ